MMMSEEMAVRLHRMMWSDMQKELGDNPEGEERIEYKERWIAKHFPNAMVHHSCFLCEFTQAPYSGSPHCKYCPIEWPHDSCTFAVHYQESPISEILALPARNKNYDGYVESSLEKASNKEELDEVHKKLKDAISALRLYQSTLSYYSNLSQNAPVADHVKAIQRYATEHMEPYKKSSMLLVDTLNKYKDKLSEQSGLDRNRPIDDHIREIVKNSKEIGASEENDRIMDKIKEVLNQ